MQQRGRKDQGGLVSKLKTSIDQRNLIRFDFIILMGIVVLKYVINFFFL